MRRPSVISSFPFVSIQQSNNYTHTCWLKQTPNWFDFPPLQFTGNIIWTCIAKNRFMLSIAHRVVKGEVSRRDNRWKGRESNYSQTIIFTTTLRALSTSNRNIGCVLEFISGHGYFLLISALGIRVFEMSFLTLRYNLFHYIQIALFLLFLCHIFVLFKKSQDRKYMKDKENQNFFSGT
jgi:hypothetical protein